MYSRWNIHRNMLMSIATNSMKSHCLLVKKKKDKKISILLWRKYTNLICRLFWCWGSGTIMNRKELSCILEIPYNLLRVTSLKRFLAISVFPSNLRERSWSILFTKLFNGMTDEAYVQFNLLSYWWEFNRALALFCWVTCSFKIEMLSTLIRYVN